MICQNSGMKNPGSSRGAAFLLLALATLVWAGNWVPGRAESLALADRGARPRALRRAAPARAVGRDPARRGPAARAVLSRGGAVPLDKQRGAEDHNRGERGADQ